MAGSCPAATSSQQWPSAPARPWWGGPLYGLMAGGERGVQRAADILQDEISGTLALLGVTHVSDLRREHVRLRGA